jgi:hypothetical protein
MKKCFILPVFLALFAACTNPLLDWIETPTQPRPMSSSDTAIPFFSLNFPGEADKIWAEHPDDKTPITVVLPFGASVSNLSPAIEFIGKSVSPGPGEARNFSSPVTYRVTALDNSWREYEVTVSVKTAQSAEIVWFDLELGGGRLAEGVVKQPPADGYPGEITLCVPNGTNPASLEAHVAQTGKTITDGQGHSDSKITSVLISDFSRPVTYTVRAENGAEKKYVVTVVVEKSGVKEITAFSFVGVSATAIIGGGPQTNGKYPVSVTVPSGTPVSSLIPQITYTGARINGPGIIEARSANFGSPSVVSSAGSQDFTASVTYTVTAENGSTRDYEVKVSIINNTGKEITGFYFNQPSAVGSINEADSTITVSVPTGTSLVSLAPVIHHTGVLITPPGGTPQAAQPFADSARNFTSPALYTVIAGDGSSRTYTVRVIPKPASAKEITAISFSGAGVLDTLIGAVPNFDGYIPISVTVSGQTDISALHPTITYTGASITPPGGAPQTAKPFIDSSRSFGSPQAYRVTAEDGSFKDYAVSVHVSGGGAKIITGFVINPAAGNGLAAAAVGQIDQDARTIEVMVPHSVTGLTSLAPTITYLGASLGYGTISGAPSDTHTNTGPAGQPDTYTDGPRDFTASRYYTVTAQDPPPDNTREYTVTVTRLPEVTVSYQPAQDPKFVTESLNLNTGFLTIEVADTAAYTNYEWYIEGALQSVSSTQSVLGIKTTDFPPGTHKVMIAAKRSADGKNYSNIVAFTVGN